MELGEWLVYQHAEREWNVQAWLTGAPGIEAPIGDHPPKASDHAGEVEDQSAATTNKVLARLTGGVRKFAALIAQD